MKKGFWYSIGTAMGKAFLSMLVVTSQIVILPSSSCCAETGNPFIFSNEAEQGIQGIKPWRREEQEKVSNILQSVRTKAPGLLELAMFEGKIALKRVSEATFEDWFGFPQKASAFTCSTGICLCDMFFDAPNDMSETLIHELVHLADFGGRLAYSQAFVSFVHALKRSGANGDADPGQEINMNRLAFLRSGDLNELLANYLAGEICCMPVPREHELETFFERHLWSPSSSDIYWSRLFREGTIALESKQVEKAKDLFEKCNALDSSSVSAKMFLARCYLKLSRVDSERCSDVICSLQKLVDRLKLTKEDSEYLRFLLLSGDVLVSIGKVDQAKKVFERVIPTKHHTEAAFVGRSRCSEIRGMYAESIDDLRTAIGFYRIPPISIEVEQYLAASEVSFWANDFRSCIKFCQQAIDKDKSSVDAMILMCKSFEKLGDKPNARSAFYDAKELLQNFRSRPIRP